MTETETRALKLAHRFHDNALVLVALVDALSDGELARAEADALLRLIETHPEAWRYQTTIDFVARYEDEARLLLWRGLETR